MVTVPFYNLRYRLEYAALRAVVGLVRLLPLDLAVAGSARIWAFVAPRLRRHSRALENLAIAYPEKTLQERDAIARAMWANLGRVMVETMLIDRIIADSSRLEIVSPPFLRYKDKLGPIVGASLHMGNWELAIWPLVVAGANPAAIYRTVKNPYVDRFLRHLRRDLYPGGLLGKGRIDTTVEEGKQTTRIIMDFVRNGGRLGVVCDLHDRHGIAVPFFGRPAPSVFMPVMIARRLGARVWMARCLRVGTASRFQIEIKELKLPRTANIADDVKQAITTLQQQYEAWIREAPEQWMWSNRRWN